MTSEAQKYIRVLLKEDPRKFFEVNEDHKNGITGAIFNEIALTSEEIINIQNFIKNGSPEIFIEFRSNCLPMPSVVFLPYAAFDKWPSSPDGTSENRLKFRLKKAELEENYEECQEIMKFANAKGWNLKN